MHSMLWRLMLPHKVYRHYRSKRMQQHGTFGEMTKPTNSAKYLMIEQPTIYSNIISILPQFLQLGYTKREKTAAFQQEWEAAVSDTHDTSQALIQVDFSEKHSCVAKDKIQGAHWEQH